MPIQNETEAVGSPFMVSCTPTFVISSAAAARAHYVNWLGFSLDFEWRENDSAPLLVQVTRDNLTLFLNEAERGVGTTLRVYVQNLEALVEQWNDQSESGKVLKVTAEPPYNLPTAYVTDPDGNTLALQQLESETATLVRREQTESLLSFLRSLQAAGQSLPAVSGLAAQFNVTQGLAAEVLTRLQRGG